MKPEESKTAAPPPPTLEQRVVQLEQRLAMSEYRVAQLEGRPVFQPQPGYHPAYPYTAPGSGGQCTCPPDTICMNTACPRRVIVTYQPGAVATGGHNSHA